MSTTFELFAKERTYRRREAEPVAEISSGGRIRFNQKATNEILSNIGEKVALGYNPNTLEIALISPDKIPPGKNAELFDVKPIAKGLKKSIPAKKFFNKKNIEIPDKMIIETVPEVREDPYFGKIIVLPIAEGLTEIIELQRQAAATSDVSNNSASEQPNNGTGEQEEAKASQNKKGK